MISDVQGPEGQVDVFEDDPTYGIWDRIYAIRRLWYVVALAVGLSVGLAFWRTRNQVPIYRAEATVQRKQDRSPLDVLPDRDNNSAAMVSEMEIIRSSSVMKLAADSLLPNGSESERQERAASIRGRIAVTQVPGTNLIRIEYKHSDPAYAAKVTNLVAKSYQQFSALKARQEASRRREFLGQQLAAVADSVRVGRDMLANYQRVAGTLNPQDQGSAVASALITAETEVRTLRFQQGVLQSLVNGLNSQSQDDALRRVVVQGRDIVPGLADLFSRLSQLETERSRLTASRFGYTKEGPTVEVLDSLIGTVKNDIRSTTEQSLTAVRGRTLAAETRAAELRSQQGLLPGQASEFGRLQQRADAVQKTFDELASKYYEAQVAEAVEAGKVEIIDAASTPTSAVGTNKRRVLFLGLIVGLIGGVATALLIEYMNRKVRTPKEAEMASGLKMLGAVPLISANGMGGSVVSNGNATAAAEAFRMLRTAIQFARADAPKIIAITSAAPGEGKSLVAANTASAFAAQGARVLLVDADLRRPTVHQIFELPSQPGLTDIIVNGLSIEDVSCEAPGGSLKVITCGSPTSNPAELMSSTKFRQFILDARNKFDYVILDTPPVLAVTDATTIAANVEGVLIVARAEKTDRSALTNALVQLRHVRAPLLGLILNCVPKVGRYGRYGQHYGYYGYSYTAYYTAERKPRKTVRT